jgi:hypothetical protein
MSLAMQRNYRYFTDEEQRLFQESLRVHVGKTPDGVYVGPSAIQMIKDGQLKELRREIAKKSRELLNQ